MKNSILSVLFFAFSLTFSAQTDVQPKREFRGAWIQIINGQFQGMSREQMQQNLTNQLNELAKCNINTIIFQVRGECDALYASPYEPWTRFLSGKQGTPPNPYWDPLDWMVRECHKRGMEIHAWINPYRAKTKGTTALAVNHPCVRDKGNYFEYDGLYVLDPGIPSNREYICRVASDIVRRYDIDGLHIDDYFYPYPVAGKPIPDSKTFAKYAGGYTDVNSWRRNNVNVFIQQLHDSIHGVKPWVKFGVSPFGIYHNHKDGSNIPGSRTNGLQNYDQLYADVLLWVEKGWIDYLVPQIYWEIGHKAADYDELIRWWSRYAGRRPLVIGQDVERTVRAADLSNPNQNQMAEKMRLQRTLPNIAGSCLWYSAAVVRNEGNFATALREKYHPFPALQPLMPFIDDEAPGKVKSLKARWMPDGYYLFWLPPREGKDAMNKAYKYVVYRYDTSKEAKHPDDAAHIVAITENTVIKLPYNDGKHKYYYTVTALDRMQNESKPVVKKIKL